MDLGGHVLHGNLEGGRGGGRTGAAGWSASRQRAFATYSHLGAQAGVGAMSGLSHDEALALDATGAISRVESPSPLRRDFLMLARARYPKRGGGGPQPL